MCSCTQERAINFKGKNNTVNTVAKNVLPCEREIIPTGKTSVWSIQVRLFLHTFLLNGLNYIETKTEHINKFYEVIRASYTGNGFCWCCLSCSNLKYNFYP